MNAADLTRTARPGGAAGGVAGVETNDWGARLLKFRRKELNLSRQVFAELLNSAGRKRNLNVACDQRLVARWETGDVRRPSDTYIQLLRDVGAPDPDSPAHPDDMSAAHRGDSAMSCLSGSSLDTVEAVGGLTLLQALATAVVGSPELLAPWLPQLEGRVRGSRTGNVGEADLELIRTVTARLRQLDQRHGGFAVIDPARGLLKSAVGLLAGCQEERTEREMTVAVADLARLVGWAYHDIGDQDQARQYTTLALVFARRADAPSLVASTLYVLGRISLIERQPQQALRAFQLGQLPAQDASNCGESARLYANEAWAHAMMGAETQMKIALSRAEEETSRVGETVDPWTAVFYTPGEFTGMCAVVYNELALTVDSNSKGERYTLAAVEGAQTSLQTGAPDRPARSVLFDQTTLATGAFRLSHLPRAIDSAAHALQMAEAVHSARAVSRLVRMADAAEPYLSQSGVKDIRHQVRLLAQDVPSTSAATRSLIADPTLG
ncbi:hypothetical protein [Nocardia gipuzkoensis]|uniref:hypothetical protein n=1 Tax=Nocardia gipuzkoensis TaxID=2749991 RepID=UPI00237D7E9D|nr:hypothetical protein [Nocardia gipuzkoensis]MDE1674743.1 hypothetical protein [Nocardia gipuzkoensis]